MTSKELLAATGNIWKVRCWKDGNRRRLVSILYIRSECILRAEETGRRRSGCKCVDVVPWNPTREACFGRYIQEVK